MIRIVNILAVFFILQIPTFAQDDKQRSTDTKIADLLALLPAENSDKLHDVYTQLADFTDADITALFQELTPPGGENAKIEYAVNSYAYHVMLPGKEVQRARFVKGAINALNSVADKDNKGFIINTLINAGKDDAVPALAQYLTDDYLADRAARTLARIKTPAAGEALLNALPQSQGRPKISIVMALGDASYDQAEQALIPLAKDEDINVRKVAYYSLAQFALPTSAPVFKEGVEKVNYAYDESNVMASYLVFLNNWVIKGDDIEQAERLVKELQKAGRDQVPIRIAALNILSRIHGAAFTPSLAKASSDRELAFSAAAFKLALPYLDEQTIPLWVKAQRKALPETQAAILQALASTGNETVAPAFQSALKSKHPAVREAAYLGIAKLKGNESLPLLLSALDRAGQEDREAIKEALLTVKADNIAPALVNALPEAAAGNQVMLMEVLANRGASQAFPIVDDLTNSTDTMVRSAAYKTLAHIANEEHFNILLSKLSEDHDQDERTHIQEALIASIQHSENKNQLINELLSEYQKASAVQKSNYLPIFAGVGEGAALAPIVAEVNNTQAELQDAAIRALASWKDSGALNELVKLSRTLEDSEQYDAVLKGLLRIIGSSDLPADQQVLLLRDAMETTKTVAQKRLILRNLDANKTYNALVFAGKYLDDEDLKGAAAMTVLNIALDNPELYGQEIEKILDKTVNTLSGNDSDYLKQALIKHIAELPKGQGYVPLFNGKDLTGWKGLVEDPIKRSKMTAKTLAAAQEKADEEMRNGWFVKDGVLWFNGEGNNIATTKDYGDFEMLVDWKLSPVGKDGDAGIYLRGTPQVQIWDTSRVNVGAQVGSGGLYNNQENESKPLKVADNPLGEWNSFRITMKGDRVTVYLNGELVTDNVVLENYWDRSQPIFPIGQIELQAHGTEVAYRDIYIKEIPRKEVFTLSDQEEKEGFKILFDGTDLEQWTGNTDAYTISDEGTLAIYPTKGSGGNLYSKEEFSDFVYRLEFRLTPGANNGIGLRAPMEGDAAYTGMEIQVLDDEADIYKNIKPYQFTGSVYGVIPAKAGHLKPVGEWNEKEIYVKGNKIRVTLNGTVIVDGDLAQASQSGTVDGREHPGLKRRSGHLAFLGHGSEVHFRNMRIKEL